jgi:hypothetical protein
MIKVLFLVQRYLPFIDVALVFVLSEISTLASQPLLTHAENFMAVSLRKAVCKSIER